MICFLYLKGSFDVAKAQAPLTLKGVVGRTMKGFASNILAQAIIKPLTTAFSVIFMWGFHAIMRLSGVEGWKMIKRINETYYVKPDEWIPWVSSYIERMTGKSIDPKVFVEAGAGGAVDGLTKEFSSTIMSRILGLIVPEGEVTEQKGMDAAANYLSINMQFQMSAWLLHLLGDVQSFGMFKSLKDLPNAISWSFGLGWLSWLVMGTPFQVSIVKPMEWRFNSRLRPSRMSEGQLMEAFRRGLITSEEWNRQLEQKGWRDSDKALLYRMAEKDYSDSLLREGLYNGFFQEDAVLKELQRKGYYEGRSKNIVGYWRHQRKMKILEDYVKEYEDLFIDDKVTEGELKAAYKELYYDDTEINVLIEIAKLKKIKARNLTIGNIKSAYDKDIIGVAKSRSMLSNMGFTPEAVDILIRTWQKSKTGVAPKEEKPSAAEAKVPEEKERFLTKSELFTLLDQGIFEAEEVVTRLGWIGYNVDDARDLVTAFLAKKWKKEHPDEPIPGDLI